MTLAQIRKYALSLAGASEEPHFDRTSFRVNGRIFATARPSESHVRVFVPEEVREPALAMYLALVTKLLWGGKVVGLRVDLPEVEPGVARDLLAKAWEFKAAKVRGAARARSRS